MPERQKALFVQPRFQEGSFWNYVDTCALIGAKYPAPPLGLITVAAMLPAHWQAHLVDCNVETLTDDDLRRADLVFIGAMLPQQYHCLQIIARCTALGVPVVVGGPDPTSQPEVYAAADFRLLGEVEGVFDEFIAAFEGGARSGDITAEKFTADIASTPTPRFDLLKFSSYIEVSVQFSRGCPFLCEFCDIIELFGRKPRTKTTDQMLREFQTLYDLGYRGLVDIVDDNLIGNKKAVKAFLPHLIAWQRARRYPFELTTEASLNLSDDPELMQMMRDANFIAVFVGIESPDPEVLKAARKKQNTGREIGDSIHRIQAHGLFVVGGFIVGFDNEKPGTGAAIVDLIEEGAIPVSMAGLLFALPNTQLQRRLEKEGRLFDDYALLYDDSTGDQCTEGLNFVTQRPRADVLRDYREVVARIYRPEAFFARVRNSVSRIDATGENGRLHAGTLRREVYELVSILWSVTRHYPDLRGRFWRLVLWTVRTNPGALKHALYQAALYVHLGPFSEKVVGAIDRRIAEAEAMHPPAAAQG